MAKYFYYDEANDRRGPYNRQEMEALEAEGVIGPNTRVETDVQPNQGKKNGKEREIRELKFNNRSSHQTGDTASSDVKISGLFDIGFTRFVINFYVPYIWVLTIVACFLGWGFSVIMGLNQLNIEKSPEYGIATIIVATIAALFSLLFSRMVLEVILVLFRIETHLRAIREKGVEQRN